MEPLAFAKLCIEAHRRNLPLVYISDGLPVRLVIKMGLHLRVPPDAATEEIMSVNGQGSSVLADAPKGHIYVSGDAIMPVKNELRWLDIPDGEYMRIDTRRISFATLWKVGERVVC